MVNIKLFTQINLSNKTAAACIAVALSRLSALLSPARAVVLYMTTFPINIQRSARSRLQMRDFGLGVILALTYIRTKRSFILSAHGRWYYVKLFAAFFTCALLSAIAPRGNMIGSVIALPQTKTTPRTKMRRLAFARVVTQFTRYLLSALIAVKRDMFILIQQTPRACFRATFGRIGTTANEWPFTPGTFFMQPSRIALTLSRAMLFRFIAIRRWEVLKILAALRTDSGYFLHCSAFQL